MFYNADPEVKESSVDNSGPDRRGGTDSGWTSLNQPGEPAGGEGGSGGGGVDLFYLVNKTYFLFIYFSTPTHHLCGCLSDDVILFDFFKGGYYVLNCD